MAEQNSFNFYQSQYRYTDPIRYFTSTDPYYWEVDNIPLKQLQENDQWLKDQIELGFKNFRISFGREELLELQPFTDSDDNIVKVRPGRFTARINDATSSNRLQEITRILGQSFSDPTNWRFATYGSQELAENIDKISSEVADDALFMNGLMDRVFTWQILTPYEHFNGIVSEPGVLDVLLGPMMPTIQTPGEIYPYDTLRTDQTLRDASIGIRGAIYAESLLTKFWRGVFRLSIVDVPERLEIEIPPFNARDFDYRDENDNLVQNNNVDHRIDLLFVYSKPVDSSGVRVRGDRLDRARVLREPTLGLVRGAGVLLRKNPGAPGTGLSPNQPSTFDENGHLKIMASPADAESTAGGFKGLNIRGSFPSPDDLMNMAPLIMEDLENNDPRLVGQFVLPLAYIVVKKDAASNEYGVPIITNADIVDIRPIFRTAELTYNERAGIAAAVPQLSIANPVMTHTAHKHSIIQVVNDYDSKLQALERRVNDRFANNGLRARQVAAGIIYGGRKFGPEAALNSLYYLQSNGQITAAEMLARHRANHDTNGLTVPYLPDWDAAEWCPTENRKRYPNDCVNLHLHSQRLRANFLDPNVDVTSETLPQVTGSARNVQYHGRAHNEFDATRDIGIVDLANPNNLFYFCKKTVVLDKSQAAWVKGYHVNVSLDGCVPQSHVVAPDYYKAAEGGIAFNNNLSVYRFGDPASFGNTQPQGNIFGGACAVWVDYGLDEFTIYVAWNGLSQIFVRSPDSRGRLQDTTYRQFFDTGLVDLRNHAELTAGFTVINSELMAQGGSTVGDKRFYNAGSCIYPTVRFEVIGYDNAYMRSMSEDRPSLFLR